MSPQKLTCPIPTAWKRKNSLPSPTWQGRRLAVKVLAAARKNKTFDYEAMMCSDCKKLPRPPVTCQCGLTRCLGCIQQNPNCICGIQQPLDDLHINVQIQNILLILEPDYEEFRSTDYTKDFSNEYERNDETASQSTSTQNGTFTVKSVSHTDALMPTMRRLDYALMLLKLRRYQQALPYLAPVCLQSKGYLRNLLSKVTTILSFRLEWRRLLELICETFSAQAAKNWIQAKDVECILCFETYCFPVTTPCGHTYCRNCLLRSLHNRPMCPLCNMDLSKLLQSNKFQVHETVFLGSILKSIDAEKKLYSDCWIVPTLTVSVAYPEVALQLLVYTPRSLFLIHKLIALGFREFGVIEAGTTNGSMVDYGTMVLIRDCVLLEDGRYLLTTIGRFRFKILERWPRNGYDLCNIVRIYDSTPIDEPSTMELYDLSARVAFRANRWLDNRRSRLQHNTFARFGPVPVFDYDNTRCWSKEDGPAWLWWLIANLPFCYEVKILFLASDSLSKRFRAVLNMLIELEPNQYF